MSKEIKILLAEDHQMVRNGLILMLEQQKAFEPDITEVVNGTEVFEKLEHNTYDLILLDLSMPVMDGIAVLKKLRTLGIETPVLVLTMHNEEGIIKQALDLGAYGYILKSSGLEELVKAILTVKDYERYFSNEISQILFSKKTKSVSKKTRLESTNPEDTLTKREIQILSLLVKEYSNQQIADHFFISKRTIEGHRKNIMAKLNIKNAVGLIKYAMENGLLDK